ncbi:MAG: hypothetical protein RR230_03445 [Oscillospiraceae bacterium]
MEYPIIADGARVGTLKVEKNGLLTVFEAAAMDVGELMRLSVFGGGAEGYLGVMQPEKGALALRKKLSRAAMSDFPSEIEYAAPTGERQTALPSEPSAQSPEAPEERPAPSDELCDVLWFSAPDGTLSTFDGRRVLVALPADDPRLPQGTEGVLRRINGGLYVVFPR